MTFGYEKKKKKKEFFSNDVFFCFFLSTPHNTQYSVLRSVLNAKCFCCNRLRLNELEIKRFVDIFDALSRDDVELALALLPTLPPHIVSVPETLTDKYMTPKKKSKAKKDDDDSKKRKRQSKEDTDDDDDDDNDNDNNDDDDEDDDDPIDHNDRIAASISAVIAAAVDDNNANNAASSSTSSTTQSRIVHAVHNQVYNLCRKMMQAKRCGNCGAFNPSVKQDSKRSKLFVQPLSSQFSERNRTAKLVLLPDYGVTGGSAAAVAAVVAAAEVVQFDAGPEDDDDADAGADADANSTPVDAAANNFGIYMTTTVVRDHMTALWQHAHDARLLDHLYGGANADEPTWAIFFLDCLAVPANRYRIMREEGNSMHSQDVIFTRVLKAQDRLRQLLTTRDDLGAAQLSAAIASSTLQVQDAVNELFDKEADPRKPSDPTGLRQLLERKEGMFRMFMMGKRVNHAARSL
jgi:DNA-directed RNA polymerase I subunit RPA1